MKKIKFTETTHQWSAMAIVRNTEGVIEEVAIGVAQSDKKLKETGAKELFKKLPEGTITVEVKKLDDVVVTYSADVEEFKKIATVEEIQEEKEPEVQA